MPKIFFTDRELREAKAAAARLQMLIAQFNKHPLNAEQEDVLMLCRLILETE